VAPFQPHHSRLSRLKEILMRKIEITLDGTSYEAEVRADLTDRTRYLVTLNGVELPVYVPEQADPRTIEWMVVDNRPYEMVLSDQMQWLTSFGGMHSLDVRWLDSAHVRPSVGDGRVKAPIPGLITRLSVKAGDAVENGAPLLVLEAMKMENEIRAPRAGKVLSVNVKPGQSVKLGELMVEVG
jgi:biotin carboxyl carrier protein